MDRQRRDLLLARLARLAEFDAVNDPIVPIDDFFIGNDDEQSIAPNDWGQGRSGIAEIYSRLKAIEARDDVHGVFVVMHPDWRDAEHFDDWPAAENIVFYTSAPEHVVERWAESIGSNDFGPGWFLGSNGIAEKHAAQPEPPRGSVVYVVCWD